MPRTQIGGESILQGTIQNVDLDILTPGLAVITKIVAGSNINIISTGIDDGTGEVTINSTVGVDDTHSLVHQKIETLIWMM